MLPSYSAIATPPIYLQMLHHIQAYLPHPFSCNATPNSPTHEVGFKLWVCRKSRYNIVPVDVRASPLTSQPVASVVLVYYNLN